MKGIELPINILIIIAVAVIVLIAVIAMFYPTFTKGGGAVTLDVAKSAACRAMVANGCSVWPASIAVYNFDSDQDGANDPGNPGSGWAVCNTPGDPNTGDNLWTLCVCRLGLTGATACTECLKDICGCPNIGPGIC